MTKTYLISEEMLQRTLNALEDGEDRDALELLREILSNRPEEPVAVLMRNETFHDMQSLHWTPKTHWHDTWKAHYLYRKDS